MSAEIWILLIVLASLAAAAAGFTYARRGAPTKEQLDALRDELEAAHRQAEKVKADVTGHFEQSAVLFGRLAHDYRAFLEHFSASARDLGISDSMARELLERADQPLLGSESDVVDTQQSKQESKRETETGVEPNQSGEATGDADNPSADMLAESQVPEVEQEIEHEQDTREVPPAQSTRDTRDQAVAGHVALSGSSAATPSNSSAEPPLIDDVVGDEAAKTSEVSAEASDMAAGVVVDVDLESGEQDKADRQQGVDEVDRAKEDTRRHG